MTETRESRKATNLYRLITACSCIKSLLQFMPRVMQTVEFKSRLNPPLSDHEIREVFDSLMKRATELEDAASAFYCDCYRVCNCCCEDTSSVTDSLVDKLTNAVDNAIRKQTFSTYDDWQKLIYDTVCDFVPKEMGMSETLKIFRDSIDLMKPTFPGQLHDNKESQSE